MQALVILAALLVAGAHAAAEPARHALRWTRAPGAESCIDADALRAAVDTRLGRAVFTDSAKPAVIIEAHVRPGWHVAIAVRGGDGAQIGQRELEDPAPDCRALDEALVLVIALIVDPDAAMRDVPLPPVEVQRTPWRFGAGVALAGAAGLLPGATLGGVARFSVDAPGLPVLELHGSLWFPDETRDGEQGGRFTLVTAGARSCVGVWRIANCVGFELGRMAGTGIGFDRVQRASALIPAIVFEPRLVIDLSSRVALTVGVATWIPLVRPRFTFEQAGQDLLVYQPATLAAVGYVGLDVRF